MMLRLTAIGAILVLGVAIVFVVLSGQRPAGQVAEVVANAAAEGAPGAAPPAGPAVAAGGVPAVGVRAPAAGGAPAPAAPIVAAAAPAEPIGGPFRLVTLDGAEVTEATLVGGTSLIFFGFTNCRNTCPPLANVGGWLDALGDDAAYFAVYYVTVDPARDDAAALGAFLAPYDDRIVGLTGTDSEIEAMLAAYRIENDRMPGASAAGYDVEHPAFAFVHNVAGAYAGRIAFADPDAATIMRLRGLAIANYDGPKLDALCGTLEANRREETLATYPASLWLTCAQRGFAGAQMGLAFLLDEGTVLPRNVAEAYVWAVRAGQAVSALTARLQEEMRPLEVAAAMQRAQDWTPTR